MRKVLFVFGELHDSDVDWLASVGAKKNFAQNSILIQEGKSIPEVYILLAGQLSVVIHQKGHKVEIATLLQGEIVGELSFLDSRPPNATVTATQPSVVLAIPRHRLSAKLARDSEFAARFYRALGVFLAHRLRQTVSAMGFEEADSLDLEENAPDELDPELLDSLALAAQRFEVLLRRFNVEQ